ncbi:hypothetical protein ACPUVO_12150 [Pseudocolwellia sp. HL-MZ19]|uniref:hypothetical protein n=1 Tax=Pseudocolwellia sp. HL-MZ19 TaxID=3400846 RepID=UPI003CFB7DF4
MEAFKGDLSKFVEHTVYSELSREDSPNTWLDATLENQLLVISEMMVSNPIDLDWFHDVIDLIRRSGAEQYKTEEIQQLLTELPVYKPQGEKLCILDKLEQAQHPLLEQKVEDRQYYKKLNISLYDEYWVESYQELHLLLGIKFSPFTKINNENLLAHIANMNANAKSRLSENEFRYFVLKSIRQATISTYHYQAQIKKIRETVPLALTQSSTLVPISRHQQSLYLPGGFTADESLSQISELYNLIHSSEEDFFDVFDILDVKKMSFEDYVKNVVVKFLQEPNHIKSKHQLLAWLCNEISLIENNKEILSLLSISCIIPDSKGNLVKTSEFCTPSYLKTLPGCLQYTALKLSNFEHQNWNQLIKLLGGRESVSAIHFCDSAKYISQVGDIDEAYSLAKFVKENSLDLVDRLNENKSVLAELINVAWIPCFDGKAVSACKKFPSKMLAKASSITVTLNKKNLCPSFNLIDPLLDLQNSNKNTVSQVPLNPLLNLIGVKTRSTIELQILNYKQLLDIEITHSSKEFLFDASISLFFNLGRNKSNIVDRTIDKIFINGLWVSSKEVFFKKVYGLPGLESAERFLGRLKGNHDHVKHGLKLLGVTDSPSKDFLIEYLKNQIGLKRKLSKEEVEVTRAVLRLLERDYSESIHEGDEIPLLTTGNFLYYSSEVYVDDGEEYLTASIKNGHLCVCLSEFNKLARKTKAKSIKFDTNMRINKDGTKELSKDEVHADISKFILKLKEPWFENSVRRLAFHNLTSQMADIEDSYKNRLIPNQVVMCSSLTLSCNIGSIWIYDTDKKSVYKKGRELYVVANSARVAREALANYVSEEFSLNNGAATMVGTLIREINSQDEANKYLGYENGVPELPQEQIYDQPELTQESTSRVFFDATACDSEAKLDLIERQEVDNVDSSVITHNRPGASLNQETVSFNPKDDTIKNEEVDDLELILRLEANINKSKEVISTAVETSIKSSRYDKLPAPSGIKESAPRKTVKAERLGSANIEAPIRKGHREQADMNRERQILDVGHRDYVSNNSASQLGSTFTGKQATQLGDWGEEAVIEAMKEEISLLDGYTIVNKAPRNNPGYDLYVLDDVGREVKRIEVKTLSGSWGDRGYHLSHTQIRRAFADKNWSLYVIFGANTGAAKIVNMGNPIQAIETFFFPNSWNTEKSYKTAQLRPFDI